MNLIPADVLDLFNSRPGLEKIRLEISLNDAKSYRDLPLAFEGGKLVWHDAQWFAKFVGPPNIPRTEGRGDAPTLRAAVLKACVSLENTMRRNAESNRVEMKRRRNPRWKDEFSIRAEACLACAEDLAYLCERMTATWPAT